MSIVAFFPNLRKLRIVFSIWCHGYECLMSMISCFNRVPSQRNAKILGEAETILTL